MDHYSKYILARVCEKYRKSLYFGCNGRNGQENILETSIRPLESTEQTSCQENVSNTKTHCILYAFA